MNRHCLSWWLWLSQEALNVTSCLCELVQYVFISGKVYVPPFGIYIKNNPSAGGMTPYLVHVTASSLVYWEPSMDGVVTRMGKGDGTAEGFREAQP